MCPYIVLWDTEAIQVACPKLQLSKGMTLLRCFPVPADSFCVILENNSPGHVHGADEVLRRSTGAGMELLVRSTAEPSLCLRGVDFKTVGAIVIRRPQHQLCCTHSVFSAEGVPPELCTAGAPGEG